MPHLISLPKKLERVKCEHSNQAIYGGCYGWASAGRLHHAPSVLKRFLGLHGGYVDKVGNHSFGAALGVMPHVVGLDDIPALTPTWPEVIGNTDLIVMFGGAHLKNTQVDPGGAVTHSMTDGFRQARSAGIRFVNVSPSRADLTPDVDPEWVPIRPNTDTALMLAIAHRWVEKRRVDDDFVARYCVGYEEFKEYLTGAADGMPKDAAWAAPITGVGQGTICDLADRMAQLRTLATVSWSVQRADHGEQPIWMCVVLAAMLGSIGKVGQGFGIGFGGISGNTQARLVRLPRPTLPLGTNAVTTRVPVGLFSDMLLHPGAVVPYNGTSVVLPDIKLIYSAGGNPFHHNGNLNRFLRAWQKPQTIIIHEPFWNPLAKHADIVLPATTTMERNDILANEYTPYWIAMRQVVRPHAQARNDFDILSELADRLGVGAEYHLHRSELEWLRHMYETAAAGARGPDDTVVTFDEFWATGRMEFPARTRPPLLSESVATQGGTHWVHQRGEWRSDRKRSPHSNTPTALRTRLGWSRANGSVPPRRRGSLCICCLISPPRVCTASTTPRRLVSRRRSKGVSRFDSPGLTPRAEVSRTATSCECSTIGGPSLPALSSLTT